jgi:hypothetical protein
MIDVVKLSAGNNIVLPHSAIKYTGKLKYWGKKNDYIDVLRSVALMKRKKTDIVDIGAKIVQ